MTICNNIKSSFYKTLEEVELVKVLLKSVLSPLCLPIPPRGLFKIYQLLSLTFLAISKLSATR